MVSRPSHTGWNGKSMDDNGFISHIIRGHSPQQQLHPQQQHTELDLKVWFRFVSWGCVSLSLFFCLFLVRTSHRTQLHPSASSLPVLVVLFLLAAVPLKWSSKLTRQLSWILHHQTCPPISTHAWSPTGLALSGGPFEGELWSVTNGNDR